MIEIVEMVSFELDEELRKMLFRLVTSVGYRKILSPHEESSSPSSKLTISTISIKNTTLSTLLILAVCRTRVLCNRPRSLKSLCDSVVEHRSTNPKVWGSIPHGESEFFFIPCSLQNEKTSFLTFTCLCNVIGEKCF